MKSTRKRKKCINVDILLFTGVCTLLKQKTIHYYWKNMWILTILCTF